jgi:hypothetical protein
LRGGNNPASYSVMDANSVADLFTQNYPPRTTDAFVEGLRAVYKYHLHKLLAQNKPFTCIVLSGRDVDYHVYEMSIFFKNFVTNKTNKLNSPGREKLAAFSFVRMGEKDSTSVFFNYLYHILAPEMRALGMTDLIHTHSTPRLFGRAQTDSLCDGPFALLWDAVYGDFCRE